MLDIKLIREKPEEIKQALLKRMDDVDLKELLERYEERLSLISEVEALKAKKNRVSDDIQKMFKDGKDPKPVIEEMRIVSDNIKELDLKLAETEDKIQHFLECLPNIPYKDVPSGGKENNTYIKDWGEKPTFDFQFKSHVELVEDLDIVDYQRGVKLGGNGFWLYKGLGARLEWGLLNFFISEHLDNGFEFILPPHILTYQCGYTAGQFPKFKEDVFYLKNENEKGMEQFLLPTAETALINLHRDERLQEEELPKKYFSYTPCFRKEAGSYRAEERGMIRGHQFNKVEMFQYTHPDKSDDALEELLQIAENLVQQLGLHYKVSKLAARDCSASMAKTYDIEIWIPSMNQYKEVSSISTARDYQARRGNIRFKSSTTGKYEFVHTLNASGLATSRLIPGIVEQFQSEDGSVRIPEVLQKSVGTDLLLPS